MKKSAKVVLLASLLSLGLFQSSVSAVTVTKVTGMIGIRFGNIVPTITTINMLGFRHSLVMTAIQSIKLILAGITIVMRS